MNTVISSIISSLLGGDGTAGAKGYSRKWLAILAPCILHLSGYPVPRDMWMAIGAYVIGQGIADRKG